MLRAKVEAREELRHGRVQGREGHGRVFGVAIDRVVPAARALAVAVARSRGGGGHGARGEGGDPRGGGARRGGGDAGAEAKHESRGVGERAGRRGRDRSRGDARQAGEEGPSSRRGRHRARLVFTLTQSEATSAPTPDDGNLALSRGGLDNRAASLSRGEHAELDRASDECVETGSDVPARAECGRGADDRRPRP